MARTAEEIEAIINDQVAQEPALAEITTTSLTGIFRGIRNIVKRAIQTHENLWDAYAAELDQRAAEAIPGSLRWYNDRAKEFQYGDALLVRDGKIIYATVDESKRIVKYAAVSEVDGIVLIKVAKDNSGQYVKLDAATELIAFRSYINAIKFAGTKTQIISIDADLVWPMLTIYFDGKLILNDFKITIETAINNYLKGIYFDGKFNVNRFRDAVEAVPGVTEGGVDISSIKIKPATGDFSTVLREYSPVSGYYQIDPAHPLNNNAQINYVAV